MNQYLVDLEDKLSRIEYLRDMDHVQLAVMCSELEDLVMDLEPLKKHSLNLEFKVSALEKELDKVNSELTAYLVDKNAV